jgi:hypothetical protein
MTTWNYRVICKTAPIAGDATYQIHEVYYREDGSVDCWTQQPVEPLGVSEPQLRNDIHAFLAAFRMPVLLERQQLGKVVLVEEQISASPDLQGDYLGRVNRASGYLFQVLGNHLLLKQDPALRRAYDQLEQALLALRDLAAHRTPANNPQTKAATDQPQATTL